MEEKVMESGKVYCRSCGKEIPANAKACPECGTAQGETKFCQHCGAVIDKACVICPKCGKQVEQVKVEQPNIVINNSNSNVNTNTNTNIQGARYGRPKNKWVAFVLCLLFGFMGAHKFYEGRIGMGVLYLFTVGLFGIVWLVDCITLLCNPNPYYV